MADFDRDATKEALDMWGRFGPPRPGTGTPGVAVLVEEML